MSDARIITIAKDLHTLLTTAVQEEPRPFSQSFTVLRKYVNTTKPQALIGERELNIIPSDLTAERAAKRQFEEANEISVSLQHKPAQGVSEDEASDQQILLVEEIIDYLRTHDLPSGPLQESRFIPLFDEEHLERFKVLTNVFVLIYKTWN